MTLLQTFWISLLSTNCLWELAAAVDAVNFVSLQFSSPRRWPTQTSTLAFISQPNINRLPIIPNKSSDINDNLYISHYKCRYTAKHTSSSIQSRCNISCAQNQFFHRQHITPLYSTTISDNNNIPQQAKETIQRLELDQQFERWKFMQCLLEGELQPSDIENVLLLSLSAYLQHGPTAATSNNKDENGGNASPVLNDEQKSDIQSAIKAMLEVSDGIGDSKFLHLLVLPPVDYESITIDTEDDDDIGSNMVEVDSSALSILEQIEQLIPTIEEDEDAYKSAWDVVIDIYGRESVRVNEEALQRERESGRYPSSENVGSGSRLECCADSLQWRTLCAVGRVLLHFDFLTKGILNENTFRDE